MAGIGRYFGTVMRALVEDLVTGAEEGVRIEVEKIKEAEEGEMRARMKAVEDEAQRIRVIDEERLRRQMERDEETAVWITPGLRPLAEPPILDWDCFFRTQIPSDLRYNALFPDDPEKRCRIKDTDGEKAVLYEYTTLATMIEDDAGTDMSRRMFYKNLNKELWEDYQELRQEYFDTWDMATPLCQFECRRLDNDGSTTHLEQWIAKGADIFHLQGDEVREKYSHLVPQDFVENRAATWEFFYKDTHGSKVYDLYQ